MALIFLSWHCSDKYELVQNSVSFAYHWEICSGVPSVGASGRPSWTFNWHLYLRWIFTHTHTEIVLKDNTEVHPNQGVSRGHPFKLRGCSLAPLNHCTPTEIRVASKLGVSTLFFLSCLFVWRATRLVSSAFVCAFQSTYGVLLYMRFCRNFVYSSVD